MCPSCIVSHSFPIKHRSSHKDDLDIRASTLIWPDWPMTLDIILKRKEKSPGPLFDCTSNIQVAFQHIQGEITRHYRWIHPKSQMIFLFYLKMGNYLQCFLIPGQRDMSCKQSWLIGYSFLILIHGSLIFVASGILSSSCLICVLECRVDRDSKD